MKKILVVDDSIVNLKLAEKVLKERDEYKAILIPSGEQALKFLGRNIPDLILLDILMPGMDGFQVLERIKDMPAVAEVPVVFLTADEDPVTRIRAKAAGIEGILIKPFNKAELLSLVEEYLK